MTIANDISSDNPEYLQYEFNQRINHSMDLNVARENLLTVVETLDSFKIDCWLIFGTLLGAVREKDFIVHDKDTDVGVFYKDKYKIVEVVKVLLEKGFQLIRTEEGDTLISLMRNNEYLDLYLFRKKNISNQSKWFCVGFYINGEFFNRFEEIEFLDRKFNIPNNSEKLLSELYGGDWKIPKVDAHAEGEDRRVEIYSSNNGILNKWLSVTFEGKNIGAYLNEYKYRKVAIYGIGELGKRLIESLRHSKIVVELIIDKNNKLETYEDIQVTDSIQTILRSNIDCVIVTPVFDFDIIYDKIVILNGDIKVLSLEQILDDLVRMR
ncbi:LicD family protein [Lysinibacillus sp. NPDC048646]|uniref:LicD family protein n=1 Tax=Lysinibacillus sp. NPDC048646 TaxID=3390574 RepID=UPI003CFC61D6